MVRLSLQLALRSGREGLLRLLITAAAVAVGVALLRRVQISPLGVVRRATPRPPSSWRLIALVIGAGVYVYGLDKTSRNTIGVAAYPGLLLTMIGIVIAGPWITALEQVIQAVRDLDMDDVRDKIAQQEANAGQ
jgi:hypothetical protein